MWRRTLDGLLIRRPGADEVLMLTGSGVALWDALDAPMSFAELCSHLAAGHDADAATIASDLEPVVSDLLHRGALVVD